MEEAWWGSESISVLLLRMAVIQEVLLRREHSLTAMALSIRCKLVGYSSQEIVASCRLGRWIGATYTGCWVALVTLWCICTFKLVSFLWSRINIELLLRMLDLIRHLNTPETTIMVFQPLPRHISFEPTSANYDRRWCYSICEFWCSLISPCSLVLLLFDQSLGQMVRSLRHHHNFVFLWLSLGIHTHSQVWWLHDLRLHGALPIL